MSETDVTVVGRVIASESFYNNMGEIYTMHTMEVYMINGIVNIPDEDSNLQFFTMGGRINEEQTIVYPSLRDIEDAEGMFLLREYEGDRVNVAEGAIYQPVAVHESYMPFNPATGEFSDGETNLGNIDQVSALVESYTGTPLNDISGHDFTPQADRSVAVPSISSLSGTSFSAGIGEELIINGSGFGATTGDVFFDNPDDGPGGSFTAAGDEDILAWNDNRIRVRVISNAGGGRLIVRTANGMQTQSSQSIDVDFAVTNLNLTSGAIVTPVLIDDEADGNGGYTFAVSNSSANGGVSLADSPAAFAALNRAITTWQQDGDYSVYLQGTTSLQQPSRDDNVNIVSFGSNAYDFDTELGSGTVGIAFSYFNSCGSSEFEVTGMDVLFRRNGNPNGSGGSVNYNFGPGGNGGTDFESVALHEFGHTHQLKHVSDPAEVMSFRITNGQTQRNISPDTEAGANFMAGISRDYDPPQINCGGDFPFVRDYLTFSEAGGFALPVEWLAFTATSAEKTVELDWSTASEDGNDYFQVERSANGTDFIPIGRVDAPRTNTSGGAYALTDFAPLAGQSYYRVAQVDFSGSRSYTAIREVSRAGDATLAVYPNPARDVLNIAAGTTSGGSFTITDMHGRRLRTMVIRPGESVLPVRVGDLPTGQYLLRADDGRVARFVR